MRHPLIFVVVLKQSHFAPSIKYDGFRMAKNDLLKRFLRLLRVRHAVWRTTLPVFLVVKLA
jgi:hypothetical protein